MNQLVLGSQSSRNRSNPAKVKEYVFKFQAPSIVSTTSSGGQFQLTADTGPVYPGSHDTVGTKGTGFKLTDFVTLSTISQYDYFRITRVEYTGSLSNVPRQSIPNVKVYSSIDWDNAVISNYQEFMERPNKSLTVLTGTAPTQKLVEFAPRRRISSNVDPSQQVITPTNEWLDCAYAGSLIFGNVKFAICCPDGQVQYSVSDQCRVLIDSIIWVEFKGRVSN
jgi:hypothetical protein